MSDVKERVHRLCVRLALAGMACDTKEQQCGHQCLSECVAAAFEPTVEQLVEALDGLLLKCQHDGEHNMEEEEMTEDGFRFGCSLCTKAFTGREAAARAVLAELERE